MRIARQVFSSIRRCGCSGSGSPSSSARAHRAVSETISAASDCASREVGLRVADPDLDRREREVRPHAPPELRVLVDRARLVEEADVRRVLVPRVKRVGDAAAREEAGEDLRPRRVEAGVDPLVERRARRHGEQLGQPVAERGGDADGAVGAADRDVRVDAERVVAPDDVAEDLVVAAVVRRVDDPLVAPARPRVRPGARERDPERLDERGELGAPLGHRRRDVGERRLLARLHLDLGRDQLADEVRLERRVPRRRLDLLEPVDEVERLGVEQRELLLDRDGEVLGASKRSRASARTCSCCRVSDSPMEREG